MWDMGRVTRLRYENTPLTYNSKVYWSDNGELVCVATEDEMYMLRYSAEKAEGTPEDEDGFEDAFEVVGEVSDKIMTGWANLITSWGRIVII